MNIDFRISEQCDNSALYCNYFLWLNRYKQINKSEV